MRILYQPTQDTPGDWQECQARDWPSQGEFDVMALNIQGMIIAGPDKYAIKQRSQGQVVVYGVHDDPNDWPEGQKWARVLTFRPLAPDKRPEYGGAINTEITQVIYAQDGIRPVFEAAYGANPRIEVKPWSASVAGISGARKGRWVTDPHYDAHEAAQSVRGWREWTEHLDASETNESGILLPQKGLGRWVPPKGTRTYYHRDTNRAAGAYTAQHENAFETTTGSAQTETASSITGGEQVFAAVTPSNEPDSSAWPTTGVYRYQIDVTAMGADCSYGLLTQDGAAGYFGRVSADLSTLSQSFAQSQSAFSSTGWKLASVTDPAWSSGNSTDRFAIVIAAYRTTGHTKQTLTLQLNETDDYADGPWTAAAAPTDHTIFFGCNF